jgi:hypothetical protein
MSNVNQFGGFSIGDRVRIADKDLFRWRGQCGTISALTDASQCFATVHLDCGDTADIIFLLLEKIPQDMDQSSSSSSSGSIRTTVTTPPRNPETLVYVNDLQEQLQANYRLSGSLPPAVSWGNQLCYNASKELVDKIDLYKPVCPHAARQIALALTAFEQAKDAAVKAVVHMSKQ